MIIFEFNVRIQFPKAMVRFTNRRKKNHKSKLVAWKRREGHDSQSIAAPQKYEEVSLTNAWMKKRVKVYTLYFPKSLLFLFF